MRWFRRRKSQAGRLAGGPTSRSEALAHRPMKNPQVREERIESGQILLTYPLNLRRWLVNLTWRLGARSKESHTRKLELDEMGSLTWRNMDGNRSVRDIVDLVSHRYNLNRRETEVAVTSFFRELGRRGLIGFRPPDDKHTEDSA